MCWIYVNSHTKWYHHSDMSCDIGNILMKNISLQNTCTSSILWIEDWQAILNLYTSWWSSGFVVVKPLACRLRGSEFDSDLAATISEIGYLLLASQDMSEISLKRRKSSKQPTKQRRHRTALSSKLQVSPCIPLGTYSACLSELWSVVRNL